MAIFFSILAAALATGFVFSMLSFILANGSRKRNNFPPSPPSLPILGHSHLLKLPTHRSFAALSKRYGPILYLQLGSLPVLLVSSSSAAQECLSTNDAVFANRPRTMASKYLGCNYNMILFANYGPLLRNLRRVCASELLSHHRIRMFSTTRKQEILSIVKRLFHLGMGCSVGEEGKRVLVELKSRFSELMFNVILGAIADQVGGNITEDKEKGREFRRLIQEVMLLLGVANYQDFFPFLACVDFGGVRKRMAKVGHEADECLQRLIDDHQRMRLMNNDDLASSKESETDKEMSRNTLIDVLLSLKQTEADCYTDDTIKGLAFVLSLSLSLIQFISYKRVEMN